MGKKIDLTGQRFGRLVVVKDSGERQSGKVLWDCKCNCGKATKVTTGDLNKGNSTSCGCGQTLFLKKDITGKRFGKLVAKKTIKSRTSTTYSWLCVCDCGNEHIATLSNLMSGNTKSCGCAKSGECGTYVEGTQISQLNDRINSNNNSGTRGVRLNKERNLWHAYLHLKGKMVFNDFFENEEDAIQARKEAEEKYFKPILEKYGKESK